MTQSPVISPAQPLQSPPHASQRLMFRRFNQDDAAVFFRLNSEPQILRYTTRAPLTSLAAANAVLNSELFCADDRAGLGRFACVDKYSGLVIGTVGLRPAPEFAATAFGYRILPEYWGRGLATEAAQAMLHYGHQQLTLEKMVATVFPQNTASIRVLEKVGLVFEREVRQMDGQFTEIEHSLWLYC
ncbi:MAG: GNAT family N-acetyltransferase [Gammaproteobacteria bacterium]|nr:GNAT family N-acetyltransferase [Gammaproteobacteria bacterium]MBU2226005.1 GNAT family N-acetyltransferase [Gammaproteobacteria bacterium]MBU2279577.1 GNAT family N-acetyltransferase [Gammaproteobacteria bacterium]MBU2427617.1 GNAT family N-acetyltransferase [Gammaproteobacteria bacterium]